jgi:hypothetical protein
MKIAIFTAVLGVCGVGVLTINNPLYHQSYILVTTVLLWSVTLGGMLKYTSQENVDFRDIYREKDRIQKQKITDLKNQIIDLEKEKLQYLHESTPTNKSAIVYDTVIVNGGVETE